MNFLVDPLQPLNLFLMLFKPWLKGTKDSVAVSFLSKIMNFIYVFYILQKTESRDDARGLGFIINVYLTFPCTYIRNIVEPAYCGLFCSSPLKDGCNYRETARACPKKSILREIL